MKKAVVHGILWLILAYLFFVAFSIFMPYNMALKRVVGVIVLMTSTFYLSGELLAYQFLIRRKNPWLFAVTITALVFGLSVLRSRYLGPLPGATNDAWVQTLEEAHYFDSGANPWLLDRLNAGRSPFMIGFLINTIIAVIAVLLRMYEHKTAVELESRDKLQRSQEAQILYLKSQVNPHFLFNTLNNLYGLSYSKSDKAPQMILGLSDTMRYLIYETEQQQVPIQKEIEFLQNYLDLERMRIADPEQIYFSVRIRQEMAFIPPLLLLPFVENCFKHGTIGKEDDGWMEISMWDSEENLYFVCKNSFSEERRPSKDSGIGLANVRKRLELIYGSNFELKIVRQDQEYLVSMSIPLCKQKNVS